MMLYTLKYYVAAKNDGTWSEERCVKKSETKGKTGRCGGAEASGCRGSDFQL